MFSILSFDWLGQNDWNFYIKGDNYFFFVFTSKWTLFSHISKLKLLCLIQIRQYYNVLQFVFEVIYNSISKTDGLEDVDNFIKGLFPRTSNDMYLLFSSKPVN